MQIVMHGMTIVYEEFGSGPAVLFAGGFSDDGSGWQKHIQTLVMAGYRVIVQNFSGVDNSMAAADNPCAEVQSEAVVDLLNYLGIGRAAIVGRSAGDPLLHTLLRRFPQRVAAVVIAEKLEQAGAGAKVKKVKNLMRKHSSPSTAPTDSGTDVVRNLLDLLNKLKQFRPRYPLLLQMT